MPGTILGFCIISVNRTNPGSWRADVLVWKQEVMGEIIHCCSVTKYVRLCNPMDCMQHAGLPHTSPPPRVCPDSCLLSWWCHPTISFSKLKKKKKRSHTKCYMVIDGKEKVELNEWDWREEWVTILNRLHREGIIKQRLPFHFPDLQNNNSNNNSFCWISEEILSTFSVWIR